MGLSLVELAIGRYPIPSSRPEDLEDIFKLPPNGPAIDDKTPPPGAGGGGGGETKSLAIFELLDYIVNEVFALLGHIILGFLSSLNVRLPLSQLWELSQLSILWKLHYGLNCFPAYIQ